MARVRRVRVALALLLAPCLAAWARCAPTAVSAGAVPPAVVANDNRSPAGELRDGELDVRLVVSMARWFPEGDDGPYVDVAAFAEEGGPPQIPAPLVRVPAGTTVAVTIRNELPDSTLWVHGLMTRPAPADDSVAIAPGTSRTIRFEAGAPGTYLYRATPGVIRRLVPGTQDPARQEREQLAGAFVVDAPGARADDRVFVINAWGEPVDPTRYRSALAINGRSWPHTERIAALVGDTLRWRVINASARVHPMHLHGFYYRVDGRGDLLRDTAYAPEQRRLAVTEDLSGENTMTIAWSPDRAGNWLFHCHLAFHVMPEARLDPPPSGSHDLHDADAGRHMAGLVLGITARAAAGEAPEARAAARPMRVVVQEGRPRGRAPRALGFVLQRDATPPAADSVEIPGSLLVLTRDQPTDITVVNHMREPTSVHWHGIELESYSDGVAGWSGTDRRVASVIPAADSFTARLTLPRAGTFIYHTHLNDIEQITSGLYGAIVVVEPNEPFDARTDHVFVAGWDGDIRPAPPHILVNGDSLPPPLVLAKGATHRLRFINIGPASRLIVRLAAGTAPLTWRPRAKDGADLPPSQRTVRPAVQRMNVGETYDFDVEPAEGEYTMTIGLPGLPPAYVRRVLVR